ncbi:MAG: DUF4845 domain-containing protein [Porticoccaceae bacterium]
MNIDKSRLAQPSAHQQLGLSSLGWLFMLAIVGFFLTALLKLGPLYLDNYFIASAVQSLDKEDIQNKEVSEIRRKLDNEFTVNNVRDISVADVQVVRGKGHTLVKVNYEKRVPFMGNVDIVVKFANEYDSSQK